MRLGFFPAICLASILALYSGPTTRSVWSQEAVQPLAVQDDPAQREFFETRIRPVLAEHCYECHSRKSETVRAGLLVDHRDDLLRGGDSGPAIVVGQPNDSLLMAAVNHESFEMPPSGKLPAQQIADLARWIEQGAWWPNEPVEPATAGVHSRDAKAVREERKANHWSWQPIRSGTLPVVKRTTWPHQPLDYLILSALESRQLEPADDADRATLIRRVTYDLTGLPPTPAAVRDFVADRSTDAYTKLVDRLLASPAFGEKWARHWLDLVRYAETCGHEFDYPIRHASEYRDYVIRAWNSDLPYDGWVREHVAGDLLNEPRIDPATGLNESIYGTGFWWLGEANHAPTDVRADEADRIDNQLTVFGKTFLGLTVGCARCHDHKFDPISAQDYFALAGFLQSTRRQEALLDPHNEIAQVKRQLESARETVDQRARQWLESVRRTPDSWRAHLLASAMPESSRPTANGERLAPELVARLSQATSDAASLDGSHPFRIWHDLLRAPSSSTIVEKLRTLRDSTAQATATNSDGELPFVKLVDFRHQSRDGWFLTGQAISSQPIGAGRVAAIDQGQIQWAIPGTMTSGIVGARLQGVLRSPTFTLQHRRIHHRLRGRGVQIRLVVDGYMMNEYSSLLFADHLLTDVDTQGEWRWVTQHRDLEHYLGHQAHLEYIDHGDGEWALESVVFADGDPPLQPAHAALAAWDYQPGVSETPVESYARALGQSIFDALRSVSENDATPDATHLVNWLTKQQIVQGPLDNGLLEAWQAVEQGDRSVPAPRRALASTDGTSENEYLQIRGNAHNLGPEVSRQMLSAISGDQQPPVTSGSGRLELASRMLADSNPFVARVMVNRLWHHLFGRGIVATVDDFGAMGQPPTHPELLDYLAEDLRTHDWSLKRTLRSLVLSHTYQLSSERRDRAAEAADPTNTYWHRAEVRRLPAESIRDAMLAVSGRLHPVIGGPSVPVHLTDFMTARGQPASGPLDGEGRKSLYIRVQRNFPSSMMLVLDAPTPFGTVGRRSQSNVPAQSLLFMNDPFVWNQAQEWAQRLVRTIPDETQRMRMAAETAWGRSLSDHELQVLLAYRDRQATEPETSEPIALWTDICHILFNTKEFLYLY